VDLGAAAAVSNMAANPPSLCLGWRSWWQPMPWLLTAVATMAAVVRAGKRGVLPAPPT
jgi:hypothetical protein